MFRDAEVQSGSAIWPNFEPDFGQVRQGSGSNFGSGLNCGITNDDTNTNNNIFQLSIIQVPPHTMKVQKVENQLILG